MLASMRAGSSWPEFLAGLDYEDMPMDRASGVTAAARTAGADHS
jgi:hypothetical protein